MKSTRQRNTAPEMALRSALHGMGLRYRIDREPVPGLRRRADIVFCSLLVAVYVDGCFWHGCPQHATWPKQNAEFWRTKIEANRQRDADTDRQLVKAGWVSIRVFEHENVASAAMRIASLLRRRRKLLKRSNPTGLGEA
jgi:DNA mismatch endonuclease (patch repair protein)